MVFYVIARNQDDHTGNITFAMNNEGQWLFSYEKLSLYDISIIQG